MVLKKIEQPLIVIYFCLIMTLYDCNIITSLVIMKMSHKYIWYYRFKIYSGFDLFYNCLYYTYNYNYSIQRKIFVNVKRW